ncbi:MAG TPA: hypothetical protein VGL09_17280 [Methylomirabilota bacterium]|jgi:hypothetical protein
MTAIVRRVVLGLVLLAAGGLAAGRPAAQPARTAPFVGACYCRAGGTLHCTSNLSERDCKQRCDDDLCDEWFWKERLPCWNWGYGG